MSIPQELVDIAARVHEVVSSDFSEPPPDPMRAALEAYEAALWQPIETAPRDRDVLVYAPPPDRERWHEAAWDLPEIVCVARWHPDAGFCVCTIREVTRWRPFLAGPKDAP